MKFNNLIHPLETLREREISRRYDLLAPRVICELLDQIDDNPTGPYQVEVGEKPHWAFASEYLRGLASEALRRKAGEFSIASLVEYDGDATREANLHHENHGELRNWTHGLNAELCLVFVRRSNQESDQAAA